MIRLECPSCGAKLKVKDELAGKRGKCPTCKSAVEITAPEPEAAEDLRTLNLDDMLEGPDPDQSSDTAAAAVESPPAGDASDSIPFDSLDDEPAPKIVFSGEPAAEGRIDKPAPTARAVSNEGKTFDPDDVPNALSLLNHYLICDHKEIVARWENDGRGWMVHLKDGFVRATTVATQIPNFGSFVMIEVGVERRDDGLHLKNITSWELARQYSLPKIAKGDDVILDAVCGYADLNDRQVRHVKELIKSKFLPQLWPEMDALLA